MLLWTVVDNSADAVLQAEAGAMGAVTGLLDIVANTNTTWPSAMTFMAVQCLHSLMEGELFAGNQQRGLLCSTV